MNYQNILLVDDDEDDQVLFIDALNQINSSFQCDVANNGQEAMLFLRTKTPTPDIIFLDLNMPKMNGYECLEEIRRETQFKHIPVVIYTTSTIQAEKASPVLAQAAYFFSKSNDFTTFTMELSRILQSELK
jgi:CheY-like chemotaxis protein